jgi:hypothetical protein
MGYVKQVVRDKNFLEKDVSEPIDPDSYQEIVKLARISVGCKCALVWEWNDKVHEWHQYFNSSNHEKDIFLFSPDVFESNSRMEQMSTSYSEWNVFGDGKDECDQVIAVIFLTHK